MTTLKATIYYSSLGTDVFVDGCSIHSDIYDECVIKIPNEFEIYEGKTGLTLIEHKKTKAVESIDKVLCYNRKNDCVSMKDFWNKNYWCSDNYEPTFITLETKIL